MSKMGVFLARQELTAVYNQFDLNKDGNIQYEEFINVLRSDMNAKRLAVVKHAFRCLDEAGQGGVPFEKLVKMYKAE